MLTNEELGLIYLLLPPEVADSLISHHRGLKAQCAAVVEKLIYHFPLMEPEDEGDVCACGEHLKSEREWLDHVKKSIPSDWSAALAEHDDLIRKHFQKSIDFESLVAERVREYENRINQLEKELKSWKSEFNMWRSAWLREIGGVIRNKHHEIDGFVLRTRDIYDKAKRFDAMDKDLVDRAAAGAPEENK